MLYNSMYMKFQKDESVRYRKIDVRLGPVGVGVGAWSWELTTNGLKGNLRVMGKF